MQDIVRVQCEEGLLTPELRVLARREVIWFVQVPPAWVADGSIAPHYRWELEIPRLLRGEKLWTILDRLHLAIMGKYQREARAAQAAAPDDPNRNHPLVIEYRLLTSEERAGKPWLGATTLRLTERGLLERIADPA
jgi:hypothetical protein